MITTVCKISYGSQTVPPIVPAVQGDTGRAISFEIADFTPPAGATATYFILKPSGEAIYNSATITDNSILCELTAQSLAEAGENRMQVRVLQGEDIVTSFEVILMVRTFLGDDAIQSGTEMNIFDKAVEQATEDFQTNAEQIVEEVIESIPSDYTELTDEVDELNERIDNIEPGLSDEAKAALLACFRHVMWTDHDDDYYNNLEEALEEEPASLSSISATYTQGATVVYPFDTLDSLKQSLVVVAHYNDESQEVVNDYTLTGDLNNSSSVVTVAYRNKVTTFTVNVTVDSALVYYVKRGTVLPGNSNDSIINTEYAPGSTNKAITIVCDFMDDLIAPRTSGIIIYSAANSGGYYAACDRVEGGSAYTKTYSMNCYGAGSRKLTGLSDASHRVRFAFTHVANTTYVYGSLYVDDTVVCTNVEMSATYKTSDNILALGGRLTGGFWGRGTFNLFAVYERVLSQTEIKSLLGVS